MFAKSAQLINSPTIRILLYVIGVPLTLILGTFAIMGILWGLMGLPDTIFVLLYGLAGFLGLVAAWLRIAAPHLLYRSQTTHLIALCALIAGTALSGLLAFSLVKDSAPIIPWLSLIALPIGLFLINATIGTKHAL